MVTSFQKDKSKRPTEYDIIQLLQDAERSNSIVVVCAPSPLQPGADKQALRLITSAYIRTHPETFSDFLLSPTTFLPLSPEEFCRQEVEPVGKEADHAQIMALAETLQIGIRVAYLDRSDVGNGEVINWVEFGPGTKEEDRPLTLLYRYVLSGSMELMVDLVISMWLRKTFY
jgi:ubiquitin thioesterase protein OTUB1